MKKKDKISYIISAKKNITVSINGKTRIVPHNHMNYKEVLECLEAGDTDGALELIDVVNTINIRFNNKDITIRGSEIFFKGEVIRNTLCEKIVQFYKDNLPFDPLVRFLENVLLNPSKDSINELYIYLDANHFALTDDGCFIAYKRVRSDWLDYHSGTFDNSVGTVVKEARKLVDTDRSVTCSRGLHVCNQAYLKEYNGGQGRIIMVKVNPKNVVSIPNDYHNTKMRCCEYTVLCEVTDNETKTNLAAPKIETLAPTKLFDTKTGVKAVEAKKTIRKRGPDGRFLPKPQPPKRGPDGRFLKKVK
jgi:hypothetical protein